MFTTSDCCNYNWGMLLRNRCLAFGVCLLLPALACAGWDEHELDRVPVGGGINGDSLHIQDGRAVVTWNRLVEGEEIAVLQAEYDGEFSEPISVAGGGKDWWGATALMAGGNEYLALQRQGPEGYGYYLQGLSAGTADLQWLAELSSDLYYEDFLVHNGEVWLAYSGLHEGEELRTLRLHHMVPGGEPRSIIGPRAIWPALAVLKGNMYVAYHNMLNYGEDLGPSYGQLELARVAGDELEVVYRDETRLHNGLYAKTAVDEEAGILWLSYVNPTRYTYPPAAPEEQQGELRLYEIILAGWDGENATQNSVTLGPDRMYHDLLLIDGVPHVYYVDQPQATIFESWIGDGYMELDTVRPYRQGGWIPAAEPKAVLAEDGTVVLTVQAMEFATGDRGLMALVRDPEQG